MKSFRDNAKSVHLCHLIVIDVNPDKFQINQKECIIIHFCYWETISGIKVASIMNETIHLRMSNNIRIMPM